ncbi:hypothetical protein GCM10010435_50800 [Winogradskya consettensis]|uniref:Uncharacterized protein n=1 Tax=Winogradskya consettensis TaxID=113560 RepID=A0A919VQE1_9ACTN|nr:hypothetical protein [Actinoplanes consettensis]GIM72087.1 hypothetical protein Aco04nite_28630 [Actinoplanes consettensis]
MSIFETVLVYAVIPFAVIAVVAALVFAGGKRNLPDRRYRPGRPYDFKPIWFLASPRQVGHPATVTAPALPAGVLEDSSGQPSRPAPVGGASDRW